MKPAPLVAAVANICAACAKADSCWCCVFEGYRADVAAELKRRRLVTTPPIFPRRRRRQLRSIPENRVSLMVHEGFLRGYL